MLFPGVNYTTRLAGYTCPMNSLGSRIRQQRLAKGLSQQDLAEKVGVTKGAVSQWELGRTLNIKLPPVIKLCEVLGVSLDYLVHGPSPRHLRGSASPGAAGENPSDPSRNKPT